MQGNDKSTLYVFWVLLDNQSTIDVFCNGELLVGIHTIAKSMTIHTNRGETVVNMVGCFLGYGWVWYNPNGIANITALTNMKKHHRVTYDSKSSGGGNFIIHVPHAPTQF